MKIIYSGFGKDHYFEALQRHTQCELYQGVNHAIEFKPDIIHSHAGRLEPEEAKEIKKEIDPLFTQFAGDCDFKPLQSVLKGSFNDLTLLTVGIGHREMYEAQGLEVRWMPEAVRIEDIHPPKKDVDKITFIGNYYDHFPEGPTRLKIAQELTKKYPDRFQLFGTFPEGTNCKGQIPNSEASEIYNNSYIGIAQDNFMIPGYFTQRYLQIMGNTLCLGHTLKESPLLCYIPYQEINELLTDIEDFINNPSERYAVAQQSHEYVKNNWTYDHWVARYLKTIDFY